MSEVELQRLYLQGGSRTEDSTITVIEDLGYIDDYVYDLETVSGDFGAGVGALIVKNTDSVFLQYKKECDVDYSDEKSYRELLLTCFAKGEEMAVAATSLFKSPILLEFEKVYFPLIMLKKKMYIGKMFEAPSTLKSKLDLKGIVMKRRDNPNITKIVYSGLVDILFSQGKRGIDNALLFLDSQIQTILDNRVDFKDLVVSKTYKTGYKSENIPHKILAEKMYARDPGSAPKPNERVPYVFVETGDKYAKQYQKVEHPDYAQEHHMKIDSLYYLDQIRNPVTQLLSSVISEERIRHLFDNRRRDAQYKKQGLRKITDFFQKN